MGRSRRKLSDQPFELEIDSLDAKGLGRAEFEGRMLRVYDALPGERVLARNLFGRSQRGKVETLEVIDRSNDRVEPLCPHYGSCSACSLQHLSADAQLARKQALLLETLAHTGQIRPETVYEPLRGPAWNYRRKARLSVRDVAAKDRVLVGFRERNGRYVADMQTCHILRKEIADELPSLAGLIKSLDGRASVPQIEIACGDNASALIIRHLEALSGDDLKRLQAYASRTGLVIYLQPKGPETVHPLDPGATSLEYRIPSLGISYRFEPLDFLQVNGGLNRHMIERAIELLEPRPQDCILDLFCGLGNFTLPLAKMAGRVVGVEGSEQMVERARFNAAHNELDNLEFHAADLYGDITRAPWPASVYNKILLDPPRTGAAELLPWIASSAVEKVLYISCNPQTLAVDAASLVNDYGFRLTGAGILDMFPHTTHSEAIALFERKDGETLS
jgi:23S rRNA (uracil1939-C5)-methyltransferase